MNNTICCALFVSALKMLTVFTHEAAELYNEISWERLAVLMNFIFWLAHKQSHLLLCSRVVV